MDWSSLVFFALLLWLATLVLFALWHWLVALVVWGPAAYGAIVLGWATADRTDHPAFGLFAAVIAAGMLRILTREALTVAFQRLPSRREFRGGSL